MGVRIQQVTKEIAEAEQLENQEEHWYQVYQNGSPSDKGGVKAGDIILEFDGKK